MCAAHNKSHPVVRNTDQTVAHTCPDIMTIVGAVWHCKLGASTKLGACVGPPEETISAGDPLRTAAPGPFPKGVRGIPVSVRQGIATAEYIP